MMSCVHLWSSFKRRLQSAGTIVQQYPSTVLAPVFVFAALTTIGVVIVIVASNLQVDTNKQQASLDALAAAESVTQVIHDMIQPIHSLGLFVQANPDYPKTVEDFPSLTEALLDQVDHLTSTSFIQLIPMAHITHAYPVNDYSTVSIGLDLMSDLLTLENILEPPGKRLTLRGPTMLAREQKWGMIGSATVFVSNVTRNETFNMPSSLTTECPPSFGSACYHEATKSKYWGFVASITLFESFVTGPSAALNSLRQKGYNYMLVQNSSYLPPTPGVTGQDGGPVTVLASTQGGLASDPVLAAITMETVAAFDPWTLMISKSSGWEPSWKNPLLATVVVVSFIIGILLFVLLLYMRQHQMLLYALMPRKMVRSMFQGDAIDAIAKGQDLSTRHSARMLQAGTPVEKLMDLLSDLMKGNIPEMRDIIALRAAFMQGGTLFQPQDLREQLRQHEALEDDVVNALLRELQGLGPELQPAFSLPGKDSSHRFLITPAETGMGTLPWALNFMMHYPSCEDASLTSMPSTPVIGALVPAHGDSKRAATASASPEKDPSDGPTANAFALSSQSSHPLCGMGLPFVSCLQISPTDQVVSILETAYGSWNFNAFELSDATEGHPLSTMFFFLVSRSGLMKDMKLNPSIVARLALAIEDGYHPNPYHNKTHAADVLQTMHTILIHTGMVVAAGQKGYCPPETLLACLLAAAGHDVGHSGVTNDFLVHSEDDLATVYSDKSPMEHFHLASLFRFLKKRHLNILSSFSKEERLRVRKVIIELVTATDMKNHISTLSQFSTMHQLAKDTQKSHGPPRHSPSFHNIQQADVPTASVRVPVDDAQQLISLQVALKCADLGNIAKHIEVSRRWVDCLEEEFFAQGDRERSLGLPISPLFDRTKPGASKSQIGFYDFVVLPLFHNFSCAFPGAKPMVDLAMSNYRYWRSKQHEQAASAAVAQEPQPTTNEKNAQ